MGLREAWRKEKKEHLGEYGDSSEFDIFSAFKAGWMAHIYAQRKNDKGGKK